MSVAVHVSAPVQPVASPRPICCRGFLNPCYEKPYDSLDGGSDPTHGSSEVSSCEPNISSVLELARRERREGLERRRDKGTKRQE
jgi:hypothetical protein